MPKKYSPDDRNKWLKELEAGKSEKWIANYHKVDLRTVRAGIIEARRSREFQTARTDLVRDALKKHQEGLLAAISSLGSSIALPVIDYAPVPWYQNKEPVFSPENLKEARELLLKEGISDKNTPGILRQHLKGNRLWRAIDRWHKAYTEHLLARLELQYKIIALIRETTGLEVVSQPHSPPFIYSYTAGELFYKNSLGNIISGQSDVDLLTNIRIDETRHCICCGGSTLAVLTGNEKEYRSHLIKVYEKVKKTKELAEVATTYRGLENLLPPIKEVISEYLQVGLLPGSCNICERIGY